MKHTLAPAFRLTLALLVLCCGVYPALVWGAAQLAPGHGQGVQVVRRGRVVGFENVGQKFDKPAYFNTRPSAVGYAADGSGGSNQGPTNPHYLREVQTRAAAFRAQNPTATTVPAELVTASGSGLDPHLSPAGAYAQVARVARLRGLPPQQVQALVAAHVQPPLFVLLGPATVNVLRLNLALDSLTAAVKH